jgi:peroxiredoxin
MASFPWLNLIVAAVCFSGAILCLFAGFNRAARNNAQPGWRQLLLLGVLLSAGGGVFLWSAFRPVRETVAEDVAARAREYLRERDVKPLSGSLEQLLADSGAERVKTQPHPLLGQPAPDFELTDHRGQAWRLHDRLKHGPVVLVFYYGYHCNHCVGQLFALNDDIDRFRELGAEVVAVSADPPELTRERFEQYGPFAFPVLNDPGNKVAELYGVYRPASRKAPETLDHGTFVIGRDGRVHWARYGSEPFTGNQTLLYELARLEGRLPTPAK